MFDEVCERPNRSKCQALVETYFLDFLQLQKIIEELTGMSEEKGGLELEHFLSQLWLILVRYQLDDRTGISAKSLYSVLRILLDPYNLTAKEL